MQQTETYVAPTLTSIGSVSELTLTVINKTAGSGDIIVIDGMSIPVPGGGVIGTS